MKKDRCALIKRAISFFLCALFLFACVQTASAEDSSGGVDFTLGSPDTSEALAVYLYNFESGKVLASKNADVAVSPASTVKMMTGLLAIEHFENDFSAEITVTEAMTSEVSGNVMGLKAGEAYSAEQLLYALICGGCNDAANALAVAVSGSVSSFVLLMNERAMEWGMTATSYANPSGIKSTSATTLADVVKLSHKAYSNARYLEMSSATRYEIAADADSPAHSISNRNALIYGREVEYRNIYCVGLSAGADSETNYCVSTVAKKDGLSYLCVVMGAYGTSEDIYSYIVANRLISWAFSSFGYRTVIDVGDFSYPVKLTLSSTVDEVLAVAAESVSVFLPLDDEGTELEYLVRLHSASVSAPVKRGDELGYLIVTCGGEEIARSALVSAEDVSASALLVAMHRLGMLTRSRFFVIFVISFVILGSTAIVITAVLLKRYKKKNRNRYRYKP